MRAIQFDRFGGPEVLTLRDLPEPSPRHGELLITVEAAGVNFADTHQVDGSYLSPDRLPYVPGSEVVGRTQDGRRVLARTTGGYAELALAGAESVIDIPDDLPAGQALALLMQGLTAWHLLRTAARLLPGESVVVHAAAGGVAASPYNWPSSSAHGGCGPWPPPPPSGNSPWRWAPTMWPSIRWTSLPT